jgi:hypothetical protein
MGRQAAMGHYGNQPLSNSAVISRATTSPHQGTPQGKTKRKKNASEGSALSSPLLISVRSDNFNKKQYFHFLSLCSLQA